jgi:hypothetical protein
MTRKDQILQNHRTNTAIAFGSKFYRRNACHARSFNIPLVGMNAPELAGIFSFPVLTNPPTQLYAWVKIASIGYCLQNGDVHHLLVIVYICICIYIYMALALAAKFLNPNSLFVSNKGFYICQHGMWLMAIHSTLVFESFLMDSWPAGFLVK